MRVTAIGLLMALVVAQPAVAKGGPRVLLVCGQSECREDSGEAWRQASTIQMHLQHRHPRHTASFYDVAWLDDSGRAGTALRYLPSLRLARRSRAQGPVWFRAPRALVRELGALTVGLSPRPASALGSPPGLPAAYHQSSSPEAPASADGTGTFALAAGVGLVLAAAVLGQLRLARRLRAGYAG
jgi:hypothetical protein